jgi:hypothetical protein
VTESRRRLNIPGHWIERPTDWGDGTKYVNPDKPHDTVRIMPGKPNIPHAAQRRPYVKRMKEGRALDVVGKAVYPRSREAHIPLDEFEFRE